MNERDVREIALRNMILKFPVGSKLYGTDTPESDEDFCGVFVAPKRFYLGLDKVEEVDFSIVSKQENGRNDKDAVDFKLYELRKFVKLALENNPNIIEMLFVPPAACEFVHPIGRKLLEHNYLFPHLGAKNKFMGYALSQRKKMVVKRDNMLALLGFRDHLEKVKKFGGGKDLLADHQSSIEKMMKEAEMPCKVDGQHIRIGDTHFQRNITVDRACSQCDDRTAKFSGRFEDYVSKHGYDTKFASHLIRLLSEGWGLLANGKIEFPLADAKLLTLIKTGGKTIEEVMALADGWEQELHDLVDSGGYVVPKKPRVAEVEALLIDLVEEAWNTFS